VVLTFEGPHDLADLRSQPQAAATGGPVVDGIALLEALLLAAALRQPPATPLPVIAANGAAGGEATAPIAVPTAQASGLLGLAGIAGGGSSNSLGNSAQLVGGGLSSSPAAAGLLTASAAHSSSGGALAGAAAPGGANGAAASAALTAAAAGFPGVPRMRLGDAVFFRARGNPELHAPLGGGLEGWMGFKEVRGGEAGPRLTHCCVCCWLTLPGPRSSQALLLPCPAAPLLHTL
jgi:hypothetical protein